MKRCLWAVVLAVACVPHRAPPPSAEAAAPAPPPGAAATDAGSPASSDLPLPSPLPAPGEVPQELDAATPVDDGTPGEAETPARSEPADPLEFIWNHRLNFAAGGAPLVTIRLMEGQASITVTPKARARLRPRGQAALEVPAGAPLTVRARDALPAALARFPLLAEVALRDKAGLEAAKRRWDERGVVGRVRMVGSVYGIAGRVIDNRKMLLLAEGDGAEAWAKGVAADVEKRFGERLPLFTDLVTRPSGRLEVKDGSGQVVATADALLALEVEGDAGVAVSRVEHDVGYAAHGFEDRTFHGRLYVTLDAAGSLAAVNGVTLEELLRGLVPSEMYSRSPAEALKAQAITARSNVLAQIGTRHLTDPYVLCSEVHCQAYKGEGAEQPSTDAAVKATRGEALFGAKDRSLVDAVYSAICGGHGEDNDAVWGGLPNPSLRGQPDLERSQAGPWKRALADEGKLKSFLETAPDGWCRRASLMKKSDKYRWEKKLTDADADQLVAPLGVGHLTALAVKRRGVSGRAVDLELSGEKGAALVHGELAIRKLWKNLPSSMFLVTHSDAGWSFKGGGWGHGAGMCQMGAVGRAEHGQGYREILKAYYAGAEVVKIY